jgi:hypothetical protein
MWAWNLSFTPRTNIGLSVFRNRVPTGTFGPNSMIRKIFQNEKLHTLYSSTNIFGAINSRRKRWFDMQ